MNIIIISKLTDKKLLSKIEPIANLDFIENIFLIRRMPLIYRKVISYHPPKIIRSNLLASEIYRIIILFYLCIFKKVDIIMGIFLIPHGIYANFFGKLFLLPVIQNLPGSDLQHSLKNKLLINIIKEAEAVIVRGGNSKNDLIKRGVSASKIFCPPNVFHFDLIPEFKEERIIEYDVIYIGNLVSVKRVDILFNAVNVIINKYKIENIKLLIVGDGKLYNELKQKSVDLGINNNIVFTGWQEDIYYYLMKSKIFIMTSESEGLPMAMIEAMACGLPCIVPDIGEINTVARDGLNSLVIPNGNIDMFAEGIYRLLVNNNLYKQLAGNALNIREEKKYEYSLGNIKNIWKEILLGLI